MGESVQLEEAIGLLPTVEQQIIRRAYGFETGGPHTDDEISRELDIPRSTVNWLKRKALATLKTQMRGLS